MDLVPHIPPIVTQEHVDLVQAQLAQNQQFARRNNTAHAYLLRTGELRPVPDRLPRADQRGACLLHLSQ